MEQSELGFIYYVKEVILLRLKGVEDFQPLQLFCVKFILLPLLGIVHDIA